MMMRETNDDESDHEWLLMSECDEWVGKLGHGMVFMMGKGGGRGVLVK